MSLLPRGVSSEIKKGPQFWSVFGLVPMGKDGKNRAGVGKQLPKMTKIY